MFCETGKVRLHYEVSGKGVPLIMLHGSGEDISIFDKALPLLEKQLKEIPSSSFTQSMQGKVAGVFVNSSARPGDAPTIKVRGTNSINYGQDPIYVIDGIVVDEGLNNINPDDIASIEVLKDASSKAIYGYRAANGVILVTTKKGRKGEGKITYDGWVGFQSYDEGNMKMLGSRDLFNLRYDAWLNQYLTANPNASDADIQDYINNTVDAFVRALEP